MLTGIFLVVGTGLIGSTLIFSQEGPSSPLLPGVGKISLDSADPATPPPGAPAAAQPPPSTAKADALAFDQVRALAAERALKPYVERKSEMAGYWRDLKPESFQKISFRRDKALWKSPKQPFAMELVHPGAAFPRSLVLAEVVDGKASEIAWSPDWFDYRDLAVPDFTPPPPGPAAIKFLTPLDQPEVSDELAFFDAGSYFRCRAPGLKFGLSARALAINTAQPGGEEFPTFERFWLEPPADGARHLNFQALMDGPSAAGAFRFRLTPGRSTVLEVEAEITCRSEIEMLGMVPFSSMFWFGSITQPKPTDYRSAVHDSDGLFVYQGERNAQWRPLDVSRDVRHAIIPVEKFIGFGLLQRERDYAAYQDIQAGYQSRPGAFVEPVGKWPAGKIHLFEMPTGEEFWDNVVVCWEPAVHPKPGQPYRLAYRIHWLADMSAPGLCKVLGSRRSHIAYRPEEKRADKDFFVIDFSQASNPEDDAKEIVSAVELGDGAKLLEKKLEKNPATGGWRATFHVQIDEKTDSLELGCTLLSAGHPISEKWNYTWKR